MFFVTEPFVRAHSTSDADKFVVCVQSEDLGGDDPPCTINTAIYLLSSQQYVISCVSYSVGWPWRKPISSNPLFAISLAGLIVY